MPPVEEAECHVNSEALDEVLECVEEARDKRVGRVFPLFIVHRYFTWWQWRRINLAEGVRSC
jgi:hypothetical protein